MRGNFDTSWVVWKLPIPGCSKQPVFGTAWKLVKLPPIFSCNHLVHHPIEITISNCRFQVWIIHWKSGSNIFFGLRFFLRIPPPLCGSQNQTKPMGRNRRNPFALPSFRGGEENRSALRSENMVGKKPSPGNHFPPSKKMVNFLLEASKMMSSPLPKNNDGNSKFPTFLKKWWQVGLPGVTYSSYWCMVWVSWAPFQPWKNKGYLAT